MSEKIKKFLSLLDVPGGSILGVWSVLMMILSVWAFNTNRDIPPGIRELFSWVLSAFAASKVAKSIWGKVVEDKWDPGTNIPVRSAKPSSVAPKATRPSVRR